MPHNKNAAGAPGVTVNARGAGRIRAGHPWIYRPDIVGGPELDAATGGPAIVTVLDSRGKRLGAATWAATARLALRMLTRSGEADDTTASGRPVEGRGDVDALVDWVSGRFPAAQARRREMNLDRDAYRVIHAESDRIPGLIVDRYADAAVVQTTSVAMNAARAALAPHIAAWLSARTVIARDDGSARDFEDLPRTSTVLVGDGQTRVRYRIGANVFDADLMTDGKTGGFLDQADNHLAVAALAKPGARAFDGFTYHGGFALALARGGCGPVLATDESAGAVTRTRENAARNGLSNVTVEQKNAFELLREFESQRARFDVVVLDPPALAKRGGGGGSGGGMSFAAASSHRPPGGTLTAADRAYRELFLRGARITEAGGVLVLCSCSGRVSRAHFEELVVEALADSGRSAQILQRLGAAADHPELAGVPETGHLKCWILRVF